MPPKETLHNTEYRVVECYVYLGDNLLLRGLGCGHRVCQGKVTYFYAGGAGLKEVKMDHLTLNHILGGCGQETVSTFIIRKKEINSTLNELDWDFILSVQAPRSHTILIVSSTIHRRP